MKINLANSIRKHRKNRKMTQEQLAEALGVSVGAVYKWEAGLSLPELNLIVEIADFFDESVDALLDYDMKDNRQGAIVDRLRTYLNNKDCSGLSEAEKALKKYPHSFDVVYESAQLYQLHGMEQHNENYLNRSIELFEASLLLLAQNRNSQIGTISINGNIARAYLTLGNSKKAIELLTQNNVCGIETDYLSQQLSVIRLVVTFVGALTMMIWYSPLMTAIALGLTVLPLVSSLLVGNQLKKAAQRVSDQNKSFTATLRECLDGFSVIKSFRAEKELRKVFSSNNELLEDEKCAKSRTTILVEMIGSIAGIIAQLGVFITCTYLALSGYGLTPGVVIVFVNLMNYMVQPVTELPRLLSNRKAAMGLIEKLATSLEQNTTPPGNGCASNISSDILVRGVSFGYDDNKEILHNISIRFEAGKAYAIVGKSGSGKSSLLNLLMIPGLKYNGQILFDKTDIRNIPSETLYELISMIQQNVFIFNASIRDNVTMFQSFNQQEIESAIQRARLSNLLSERGEGYLCGENGSGLSGGEKQRISIARSLLKRSTILLADEITSALDVQTAYQVTSDILDLRGITRIMVTHSMEKSLLQRYDGIVVLKDGYIEEVGRFDDLMERKGYFYALYTVGQ